MKKVLLFLLSVLLLCSCQEEIKLPSLRISDGRTSFFQWDLNQKLIVENADGCNRVHFTNSSRDMALVAEVKTDESGVKYVNVPNSLLTVPLSIEAYLYKADSYCQLTVCKQVFGVTKRDKPENYVYTEGEHKDFDELLSEMENNLELTKKYRDEAKNDVNNAKNEALNSIETSKEDAKNEIQDDVDLTKQYRDEAMSTDIGTVREDVDDLKGDLAQLQKENGINNEQINGEISDIKISYEGEVGSVYNSGYVIKVSGNTAYKRAIIDISSFNKGTLTFIFDGTACYLSNTPTVDGSNNFINNLNGNSVSTWEKIYGLYVSGNVATLDIEKLKQNKPEAKGMFVCCEVANWVDPYITYKGSTKSLEWLMISEDNLNSEFKKKISQIEINKNAIEELQKQSPSTVSEPIVFFGDSLTHGATTSYNDSYPKQFSDLSGLEIKNFGVSGEDVPTIMGRQGSQPFIVQPFTIPSDTSAVEVEIVGNQGFTVAPLKVSPNANKGLNPCYINGIEGTLTRDTTSGMYYFARTTSGTEVEVNRPTPIITNASVNFRDNPTVIWMGQNGGYNSDDTMLVDDFVVALNYCKSEKVLIMAPFDGYGSSRANIEKLLTQRFGRKFINVRDYLVKYGLSDLNITPTDEDNADLENDRVPNSLRTDATHLTTEAYGIVARLVYERGQELGYWN